MNHIEMNLWRESLELPFSGIKDAKSRARKFESRYERLNNEARELIDKFNANFKGKTSPVYLHRASNTSAKIMKWRLSAAKIYGFSDKAKSYALLTDDVLNLLRASDISEDTIHLMVEYDFKRINLNYALSFVYAELKRLDAFILEFEAWRKLPHHLSN